MSLPPLANLIAFRTPDPRAADAFARRLTDEGVPNVARPHPTWVVATDPFPGAPAVAGFAEGAGRVGEPTADITRVAIEADGSATIVRSAGGLVPVYLDEHGAELLVTTWMRDMIRFRRREPELDPLVNAIWTTRSGAFPDRRTPIAGVSLLPRGHRMRVDPAGGTRLERWWDARPATLTRGPENAHELRAALVETLTRELDPDAESLLTLSGGVDSSAIGALAGTLGRRIVTASLLPVDPATRARDLGYIEDLAAQVPNVRLGLRETLTMDLRLALLDQPTIPWPLPHPVAGFLPRALRATPARVVVGGEFADHTVGSTMILEDWAAHTPARRLVTGPLPRGRRADARAWIGHRVRERRGRPRIPFPPGLPDLIRDDVRAEYAEWYDRRRRAALEDERPHRFLAMLLEREGFLSMHWEVTSALGVRRCFPFATRRVLELALRTDPADVVGPGTKRLLRAALAGDVPHRHLHRPDKGQPGAGEDRAPRAFPGPLPAALTSIVRAAALDEKPMPVGAVRSLSQLVSCASASDDARATRAREGRIEHPPVPYRPPSSSERPDD